MTVKPFPIVGDGFTNGFDRAGRQRSRIREAQVASAARLVSDVMRGAVPYWYLAEANRPTSEHTARLIGSQYPGLIREEMTTSDLPFLTGDVIDRMMLARFRAFPSEWRKFVKIRPGGLRDFRTVRSIAADGVEAHWPVIPEADGHTIQSLSETNYSYAPKKYGSGAKFSFESMLNDDLGAFQTIPDRLGRGGARTIARFVSDLYLDTNGPDATFFSAGNGNIVTSNPVLSVAALGTAFNQLGGFTDSDSEPIFVEEAVLVIGPGLRVTANNIMNQLTVDVVEAGGTSNQTVRVSNWIIGNLILAVDPYLPIIAATAIAASQQPWVLFADPMAGRPAIEIGQLRGFEEPALYQKLSNTVPVGSRQDLGDFQTMSQEFKGVMAFGGIMNEPKSAVGSNGSGS